MARTLTKSRSRTATGKRSGTTAAEDILAGMRQLVDVIQSGRRPADVFPSRTYTVPPPSTWTAERIRALRGQLGVAPPVFAKLVGVSTILAQGWEQGRRTPAPVAARLLDTIDRNPVEWLMALGGSPERIINARC